MTSIETCILAMAICCSWILKKLLLKFQDYHEVIIRDKSTKHKSNWKSAEQRCLKSMPLYEIFTISKKTWKDPKFLRQWKYHQLNKILELLKKGTGAIVGDSMISGLKENFLSNNGSIKMGSFPGSTVADFFFLFNVRPVLQHDSTTRLFMLEKIMPWTTHQRTF